MQRVCHHVIDFLPQSSGFLERADEIGFEQSLDLVVLLLMFHGKVLDDESLTDGEDLQFLLDGELDEEDDDDSWDADFFSSEKETSESNEDTDDDSAAGSWLRGWPSEDDEESDDNSGDDNDGDDSDSGDGSSDDGGDDDDNDDDDSSDGASPPAKCRKANGVYWW
ncbi:prostatic spermine-binding protein-like [Panicum hallii]|uniref:prostatic spermine-binding protein-like n=1 Tax=Panicum hallii TaxID=206008 RepID=UPI000DF4CEF2|nr:prostatic spermine-binding protein-like [Panicum hallii]